MVRKLPREIQGVARRNLIPIDSATRINDLRVPPGNRIEKITGDHESRWSVTWYP